jgi:hypothetical protein
VVGCGMGILRVAKMGVKGQEEILNDEWTKDMDGHATKE